MDSWNSRGQRRDQLDMDINSWYNDWSRQCGPMNDGYDNRPPGWMPPMRPPPPGMMGPPHLRMPPLFGPPNLGPRMMAPSGKPLRPKVAAPKTDNTPPHIFKSRYKMPRAVRSRYDQAVDLIVTQMKEKVMAPPKNTMNQNELKLLRENIRKRLDQLLLNKAVPSCQEMLNLYRKSHPRTGDEAFLIEVQALIDKEDILVVKENVASALQENLDDMFAKLQNIYGIEPNGDAAAPAAPSETANTAASATDESNEMFARIVDIFIKKSLPKVLPAFKDTLIAIMRQYKNIVVTDKPEEQPKEDQNASGDKISVDQTDAVMISASS